MTQKQHRAILMSTRDIEFKGSRTLKASFRERPFGNYNRIRKNHSITCNACKRNQYPDNIWRLEYKDDSEWQVYDVYCDDCCEEHFPEADLISVGIKQ